MAVHFAGIRSFSFKCESMDDDPDLEITGEWSLVTCATCLAEKVAQQMARPALAFHPKAFEMAFGEMALEDWPVKKAKQ